jgi:hypothetical protein
MQGLKRKALQRAKDCPGGANSSSAQSKGRDEEATVPLLKVHPAPEPNSRVDDGGSK